MQPPWKDSPVTALLHHTVHYTVQQKEVKGHFLTVSNTISKSAEVHSFLCNRATRETFSVSQIAQLNVSREMLAKFSQTFSHISLQPSVPTEWFSSMNNSSGCKVHNAQSIDYSQKWLWSPLQKLFFERLHRWTYQKWYLENSGFHLS